MARIFRRGELKQAVLIVAAALEEAHGYGIMTGLQERVGGGWKASPGAIYPALLALVQAGHLRTEERDDVQVYVVTPEGRRAAEQAREGTRWALLAARSVDADAVTTVGTLLDRFAASSPIRRRLAGSREQAAIDAILTRAHDEITRMVAPDIGQTG
jgi:DNA-binding PadR family transcriptional regulator